MKIETNLKVCVSNFEISKTICLHSKKKREQRHWLSLSKTFFSTFFLTEFISFEENFQLYFFHFLFFILSFLNWWRAPSDVHSFERYSFCFRKEKKRWKNILRHFLGPKIELQKDIWKQNNYFASMFPKF